MKTHKKLVSILCAAALLVSALPAAAAVEPLSEYAGETVSVHVTRVDAGGVISETCIDVDVPKNATVQEGQDVIQTAAIAAVSPATRAVTEERFDDLCTASDAYLTTSYKFIRRLNMKHDYTRLVFQLNYGTITNNPTNVTLRLTDRNSNVFELDGELMTESNGKKSAEIIIYEDVNYNGKKIPMYNGTYLNMDGKVDSGTIAFAGFMVKGYYNA